MNLMPQAVWPRTFPLYHPLHGTAPATHNAQRTPDRNVFFPSPPPLFLFDFTLVILRCCKLFEAEPLPALATSLYLIMLQPLAQAETVKSSIIHHS